MMLASRRSDKAEKGLAHAQQEPNQLPEKDESANMAMLAAAKGFRAMAMGACFLINIHTVFV